MVEMGEELVDVIRQAEPDAQVQLELSRGVHSMTIHNHVDMAASFDRSPLSISMEVRRIQGDDVLILDDVLGTTIWDDDYLASARRLRRKLELARLNTRMQSGRMPVLFAPTGALVLALPLVPGLSGKNVFAGMSPLARKQGQEMLDSSISIVDDATVDGKFNSASHDDEGVPHRRNVLVERGVLQSFYYDLKTAAQSHAESTGNGSRSLFNPPEPTVTNLILEPGSTQLSDIMERIDSGLWVENALGLGQGNIISGAFSNPLSLAYKIENGQIVGRVKDVSIAGNVYELLQDVAAVSQEAEWVYKRFRLPHVLLPSVNVVCSD
jgi:PmbA protein